jgi:hypothetical protein
MGRNQRTRHGQPWPWLLLPSSFRSRLVKLGGPPDFSFSLRAFLIILIKSVYFARKNLIKFSKIRILY